MPLGQALLVLALAVIVAMGSARLIIRHTPPLTALSLQQLTVPTGLSSPVSVRLHNGVYTTTQGRFATETRLSDTRFGDIDHDGDVDAVALVRTRIRLIPTGEARSSDSLPATLSSDNYSDAASVVAFLNIDGRAYPVSTPVFLGANVNVTDFSVAQPRLGTIKGSSQKGSDTIHVTYLDPGATLNPQGTSYQALAIGLDNLVLRARPIAVTTHRQTPRKSTTPLIGAIPGGENQATAQRTGLVASGGEQIYTLSARAGQTISISLNDSAASVDFTLVSPAGTISVPAKERRRNLSALAANSGTYYVAVSSTDPTTPAQFTLSAQVIAAHFDGNSPGVNTDDTELHLTFDGGPDPTFTPQILELLKQYRAHATFFAQGDNAKNHPELIKRIVDDGNTVGSSTVDGSSLVGVNQEQFDAEVGPTRQALGQYGAPCLRSPEAYPDNSIDNNLQSIAASEGLHTITWNIDSDDAQLPGADVIANNVINHAGNGSIALLHDGGGDRNQTIAALKVVLSTLSARGWSFESLCRTV